MTTGDDLELTRGQEDYHEYDAGHNLLRLAELLVAASLTADVGSAAGLAAYVIT